MFNIPRIQEMIEGTRKFYGNQTVTDHYNRRYEKYESMCPPMQMIYAHPYTSRKMHEFFYKYNKRCTVSELLADEFAANISSVPTERTQTPEEALELSIWSPFNTFNISAVLRFYRKTSY